MVAVQSTFPAQENALVVFDRVSADGKLLSIWSIYQNLGRGIYTAAPAAVFSQVVQQLLRQFNQVPRDSRLEVLRDMVSGAETSFYRAYAGLSLNMKLAFWYRITAMFPMASQPALAQSAQDAQIKALLQSIEAMDLNQQVHLLKAMLEDEA